MWNLLKFELLSRRGLIIGWGIGLTLFGALYVSLYPEIEGQISALANLSIYQAMGISMSDAAGYVSSTAIKYAPILLVIFAIGSGTAILAGEEESGSLELILAAPLKRWQVVSIKALALAIITFFILVIAALGNYLVYLLVGLQDEFSGLRLIGAILNAWPITMTFLMISLWLGALMPSRRFATMVTTVIFVINFFGDMVVNMVDSLEPIRKFLFISYFQSNPAVLLEGPDFTDALILIGCAAVFYVLAMFSFQKRNVTTGSWSL